MADPRELVEKETALIGVLPDFARSCRGSEDVVIIHQDSFAADYQDEEGSLPGGTVHQIRQTRPRRQTNARWMT